MNDTGARSARPIMGSRAVMGGRGRGGLADPLFRSVGGPRVAHASCPVLVVRPEVAS
ncbi:universal stress protein [Streptomyces sp. NPDC006339]|uniref:universal stress protein n=1 Tax=Streptomyces sp. NPDC006339 TaxID=3156755 RepID=UPI00339F3273